MSIESRLRHIHRQIDSACQQAGRQAGSVRLLPVSKTHPLEAILQAAAAGEMRFGENRAQEVVAKAAKLAEMASSGRVIPQIEWSVIGPLQRNKAKYVARYASEFQALESVEVAAELDKHLNNLGRSLDVLIEVKTSPEPSKFGVCADELGGFARQLTPFTTLNVVGLMTIATHTDDKDEIRRCFDQLAQLRRQMRDDGVLDSSWNELSMGMSGDFEAAIAAGSTCVRVGTAIFGARQYGPK